MKRENKEHDMRKNELTAAAKILFFQKGYENTTIQDIIDSLGIAKGTFYHYFKSKDDLLDTLVDQMITEMSQHLKPIANSKKNAIEKINDFFHAGASYKVKNLDVFIVIIRTLYRDENQQMRERMFQSSIKKNSPIIASIVKQGIKEGVFNTEYPDLIGETMINLGKNINEAICKTLLKAKINPREICEEMAQKILMYQDMIERILGAPKDTIKMYVPGEFEKIVDCFLKGLQDDSTGDSEIRKRYKMW